MPSAPEAAAAKEARQAKMHTAINKADKYFNVFGLGWMTPILRMGAGDDVERRARSCGNCSVSRCWPSSCS